jgi:hypothetical protein
MNSETVEEETPGATCKPKKKKKRTLTFGAKPQRLRLKNKNKRYLMLIKRSISMELIQLVALVGHCWLGRTVLLGVRGAVEQRATD